VQAANWQSDAAAAADVVAVIDFPLCQQQKHETTEVKASTSP